MEIRSAASAGEVALGPARSRATRRTGIDEAASGPLPAPTPLSARALRRLCLALALAVVPGAALAATVKGKLAGGGKLLNPVWNEAKDPAAHRYSFREPSATVRPDVRTLTGFLPKELCIAALGEKGAPLKVPYRVVIAGGRTSPVTLVVAPGQQIQFENQDPFPHRIFVVGGNGMPPGEVAFTKSRAWTPPGPGKFEIRDQLSPSIRSWIVVEARTVAVGYPDRKGEYAIELEPGKYTLRAFFNGEPVGAELPINVNPNPAEQLLREPLTLGDAPAAPAAASGAPDAGPPAKPGKPGRVR